MSTYTVNTQFGPAVVRVHRLSGGWRAMLVGRHLVPRPPVLRGPVARSESEAVAQLVAAIGAISAFL